MRYGRGMPRFLARREGFGVFASCELEGIVGAAFGPFRIVSICELMRWANLRLKRTKPQGVSEDDLRAWMTQYGPGLDAVDRGRVGGRAAQERILAGARAEIAAWLERGAGFEPLHVDRGLGRPCANGTARAVALSSALSGCLGGIIG